MGQEREPGHRFEGHVPAVPTPFNEAGDLMIDSYAEGLRWYLDEVRTDGICVAGDNGEAWALTLEDRRRLAETTVKVVGGRVPTLMGASAPTSRQSIEFAEIAAEAGIDALMTGPQPYVLRATKKELVLRFETIHKAVPLPFVVYNSPTRTGLNLGVEELGAICDAVSVVGLKEASSDMFHISNVIRVFGERFCVFVGSGECLLPGLALGGRGFISTGPELFGETASRFRSLATGKPSEESLRLHLSLARVFRFLMDVGTRPSAFKAALNLIGFPAGVPREPVQPLTPEDTEKLQALLQEVGILAPIPA
jgi:4-hydroxy-tetrahydrodipicolinate synthase